MLDFYESSAQIHTKRLLAEAKQKGINVPGEFSEAFQKSVAKDLRETANKRRKQAIKQEQNDRNRLPFEKAV